MDSNRSDVINVSVCELLASQEYCSEQYCINSRQMNDLKNEAKNGSYEAFLGVNLFSGFPLNTFVVRLHQSHHLILKAESTTCLRVPGTA